MVGEAVEAWVESVGRAVEVVWLLLVGNDGHTCYKFLIVTVSVASGPRPASERVSQLVNCSSALLPPLANLLQSYSCEAILAAK